jgi:hypothetical protein
MVLTFLNKLRQLSSTELRLGTMLCHTLCWVLNSLRRAADSASDHRPCLVDSNIELLFNRVEFAFQHWKVLPYILPSIFNEFKVFVNFGGNQAVKVSVLQSWASLKPVNLVLSSLYQSDTMKNVLYPFCDVRDLNLILKHLVIQSGRYGLFLNALLTLLLSYWFTTLTTVHQFSQFLLHL